MGKIAILVDSTSGVTNEKAKAYGDVYMIPLYFLFGEEAHEDLNSFNTKEFFVMASEYYNKTGLLPKSSQPPVGRCIEMYEELLKEYDHIIYYTISTKLSGTYQSAVAAAVEFAGKVTVLDSRATASVMEYAVRVSADMVKNGASVEEIVAKADDIFSNFKFYFVVDTLEYLYKNGRIGGAAQVIGNALQLKPVLELADGEIKSKEKVRKVSKAHQKLISYVQEHNVTPETVFWVVSADADDYATNIMAELKALYPNNECNLDDLSPVVAVHTGPKTVGIMIMN